MNDIYYKKIYIRIFGQVQYFDHQTLKPMYQIKMETRFI